MVQRLNRVSRLTQAERELSMHPISVSKDSMGLWTSLQQVRRGERPINHVAVVLKTSLILNIVIVLSLAAVAVASKSLALLSAMVENVIDLFVHAILAYAGTRTSKNTDHVKFPAGASRLEPVAVIIAASVMVIVSVVFIQEGVVKLVDGFGSGTPEPPHLSVSAIVIVTFAVVSKIILNAY